MTSGKQHIAIESDRGPKDILVENGDIISGIHDFKHGCSKNHLKDMSTAEHFNSHVGGATTEENVRELC